MVRPKPDIPLSCEHGTSFSIQGIWPASCAPRCKMPFYRGIFFTSKHGALLLTPIKMCSISLFSIFPCCKPIPCKKPISTIVLSHSESASQNICVTHSQRCDKSKDEATMTSTQQARYCACSAKHLFPRCQKRADCSTLFSVFQKACILMIHLRNSVKIISLVYLILTFQIPLIQP